ncbi:MAG: hypothetical protein KKE51_19540 [Gammaproteobacteria bacterium]|nr:hypothetical protein [Gammaproteobacteria bacterium]MBU1603494.1 hypothetical protein [Gammaproteobacteria bacterium]MBU2433014.1 hypothetical protein [Gammaproteobacteria bacterium]MBU2450257.1 hypothetical protein [Gammaproteobacteria bacterium]
MLSFQDVIDYCDLDEGEIEAIAEHEHIPVAVAAEMSEVLLCTPDGVCRLHSMIIENMQHAIEAGRYEHVKDLAQTYQHLQRTHPIPSN